MVVSPWVGPRKIPTEFRGSFPAPLGDHCTISAVHPYFGRAAVSSKILHVRLFPAMFQKTKCWIFLPTKQCHNQWPFQILWQHGSYCKIIFPWVVQTVKEGNRIWFAYRPPCFNVWSPWLWNWNRYIHWHNNSKLCWTRRL